MYVENIKLTNYRNYLHGAVSFINGINVIYGENALGKTNVLEAIHILATSKSHRLAKEREIINLSGDEAKIQIDFFGCGRKNRGEIILKANKKKQYIKNKVPVTKTSEIMGFLNVVMFCPEDLKLIKGSPRDRRRMMDIGICQLSTKYFGALINYNRVLEQKNNLLRENKNSDDLWVWNDQLVEYGSFIAVSRQNYLNQLQQYTHMYNLKIANEQTSIEYQNGISSQVDKNASREEFKEIMKSEIKRNTEREIKLGQCIIGPHRDDFTCLINSKEARLYGSQGQQRTTALCIKLAEVDITKKHTNELPILLLDDVLSELDEKRQDFILNNLNNTQTIITCTHHEKLNMLKEAKLIKVEDIHVHSLGG